MREHWIGDTKIGKIIPKKKPNKEITYPTVRFPKEYTEIIGQKVSIYMSDNEEGHIQFRLKLEDDSIIHDKMQLRNAVHDFEKRLSMVETRIEKLEKR